MADFRLERLFVMLDEPIPGLNHLGGYDPAEFAWHGSNDDAMQLGLTPLDDFSFAPYDEPCWRPAAEGLATIRGLIALYEDWLGKGNNPHNYDEEVLREKIEVLTQVEVILDAADSRDRQFYLAAKDLG